MTNHSKTMVQYTSTTIILLYASAHIDIPKKEKLSMKNKYLIVIDMQNDFVNGALSTPEAIQVVPAVVKKVQTFDGNVIFTQDTHFNDYLNTQEGKCLPIKHCILHTPGWELISPLQELVQTNRYPSYQKSTFASMSMAHDLLDLHAKQPISYIELIGVCTDICVISNALCIKALLPEVPIIVDASCCAGITPEKHLAALTIMESCQIQVRRNTK